MTFDHDYAEKIQAAKNRDLRSKSELSAGLERLRQARDAAYLAADSFKAAGNATGEAQCFGEGIGLEKAAMLIYGQAL